MASLLRLGFWRNGGEAKFYFIPPSEPKHARLVAECFDSTGPMGNVFGFPREASYVYEARWQEIYYQMRTPGRYVPSGDFPEEYFNQWATIWKELWMCADQVKIKDFRDNMTWKKWREECWPPEKRDLLMFGPSVYCESCDTQEPLLMYFWHENSWCRHDARDRLYDEHANTSLLNTPTLFLDGCAGCCPQSYRRLISSGLYMTYSVNGSGVCKCQGCRAL